MRDAPDPRPGFYYVSCQRDDGECRLVRGPWPTHLEALAAVPAVREEAEGVDDRAIWYAWGTARSEVDVGPGVLGQAFVVSAAVVRALAADPAPSSALRPRAAKRSRFRSECPPDCRACRRPDIEPDGLPWDPREGDGYADLLRLVGFPCPYGGENSWVVATYAIPVHDRLQGSGSPIAVRIWLRGELAYDSGTDAAGLVRCPLTQSLDSDGSTLSVIRLVCELALIGQDGNQVACEWDAEDLLQAIAEWAIEVEGQPR